MSFWKTLGEFADSIANAPQNSYRAGFEHRRNGEGKDPSIVRLMVRENKQLELTQQIADAYAEGYRDGQRERMLNWL